MSYNTNRRHIARVLAAAAVLLENKHPNDKLSRAVRLRAIDLISAMWNESVKAMRTRSDIQSFWTAVKTQAIKTRDIFGIEVSHSAYKPTSKDFSPTLRITLLITADSTPQVFWIMEE